MYIIGSSIGSRARHKKWEMLSDDFFGMDGFQWGKHFETDVSSTNRRTYVYIYIPDYMGINVTVTGRNPANQLIGYLPHYLQGLYIAGGAGFLPPTVGYAAFIVERTNSRFSLHPL